MGLTKGFNLLSEFKHDTNEAQHFFNIEGSVQKFSLTHDEKRGNIACMSGGLEGTTVTDRVVWVEFSLNISGDLQAGLLNIPKMKTPRFRHSSFI